MQPKLKQLVNKGLLWQGRQTHYQEQRFLSTGHPSLNELLGGGWQFDAVHEWQLDSPFIEQKLLWPLLEQLHEMNQPIFWLNPPALLSAAGLRWRLKQADSLHIVLNTSANEAAWAFEQILQSGAGVAFLWQPESENQSSYVRRWQKAVQQSHQMGFVLTALEKTVEARAYTNRLHLHPNHTVDVVKRRYGWPVNNISL